MKKLVEVSEYIKKELIDVLGEEGFYSESEKNRQFKEMIDRTVDDELRKDEELRQNIFDLIADFRKRLNVVEGEIGDEIGINELLLYLGYRFNEAIRGDNLVEMVDPKYVDIVILPPDNSYKELVIDGNDNKNENEREKGMRDLSEFGLLLRLKRPQFFEC